MDQACIHTTSKRTEIIKKKVPEAPTQKVEEALLDLKWFCEQGKPSPRWGNYIKVQ